jgi:hypothetical protein
MIRRSRDGHEARRVFRHREQAAPALAALPSEQDMAQRAGGTEEIPAGFLPKAAGTRRTVRLACI